MNPVFLGSSFSKIVLSFLFWKKAFVLIINNSITLYIKNIKKTKFFYLDNPNDSCIIIASTVYLSKLGKLGIIFNQEFLF